MYAPGAMSLSLFSEFDHVLIIRIIHGCYLYVLENLDYKLIQLFINSVIVLKEIWLVISLSEVEIMQINVT